MAFQHKVGATANYQCSCSYACNNIMLKIKRQQYKNIGTNVKDYVFQSHINQHSNKLDLMHNREINNNEIKFVKVFKV